MKNILYILSSLFVLLTLTTSCNKFLDKDPLGQISQDELFNSETNANAAVMGVYRSMMNSFSYGQSMLIVPEFSARHVRHSAVFPEYENFAEHKIQTINPWISNMWQAIYATINASNQVIEEVTAMDETMISVDKKDILVSEAKFIRALNYFFLVRAFNKVPLKLTYTKEDDDIDIPQAETQAIYEQIIQDLTEASEGLPKENPYTGDAARGRASYWGSKALLAKVYLYQGAFTNDYSKAANLSQEIIKEAGFSLVSDYGTIWSTQNSPEALFEIQFDDQATNPLAAVANDNASVLFLAKDSTILDLYSQEDKRKDFTIQ
ncbi:MAG: RagB/SusD family nutrient uptake outer membrane protein [Sphingobacterium sp.]